ncbi:Protein of unknown function [Bacillus mycoides]|nr:Protein of unknown function [Bacillus mycoides]
MMMTTTTIK